MLALRPIQYEKYTSDLNEELTLVGWKSLLEQLACPQHQGGLQTAPQRRQAVLQGHCHQLENEAREEMDLSKLH